MSSPNVILAIVRAARPTFRSRHDKLAFAIHAVVSANGYKLVAVGSGATLDGVSSATSEVGIEGWNVEEDQYRFIYVPDQQPAVLLHCLVIGDILLATFTNNATNPTVETIELDTAEFTTDSSDISTSFAKLEKLAQTVQTALDKVARPATTQQPQVASGTTAPQPSQQQPPAAAGRSPDDDPLRIGPARRPNLGPYPGRHPLHVGPGDYIPSFSDLPTGVGMGPPGIGEGGLHVGPDHPYFRERLRHPELFPGHGMTMPPPSLPPGARWDPIRPPGMEGYQPEDFRRDPGRPDHDVMPRPPVQGPDWDSMYG